MDFLITDIISAKEDRERFLEIKRSLIREAVSFPAGTAEKRVKTSLNIIDETEAAFFKPGKEASRSKPNVYDMYPAIIYNDQDVAEKFSFEDIWEYLLKVFLIHKGTFIKILVLLYRLCFFYDHSFKNGKWRYSPSAQIRELIHNLDELVLRDGFADKFKEPKHITVLQTLMFVDLLSWNEDVKYHAPKKEPYFNNFSESRVGRTNTVLSVISAPLLISQFIEDIVSKTQNGGVINVKLITTVIQKFTRTRGLCALSSNELQKALEPYLRG